MSRKADLFAGGFSFREQLIPGFLAVKRFLLPIIILQICAVSLVVAYYTFPTIQKFCTQLGEFKVAGGLPFVALSTIVAGVLIPECAKLITGRWEAAPNGEAYGIYLFWVSVFFAGSGFIVDSFYKIQNLVFGTNSDFAVLFTKIMVDQFVFTPIIGQTYGVLFFLWMEQGRSFKRWLAKLSFRVVFDRIIKICLPGWIYWIPMVGCIYSLPPSLQFPFFLLALACWSLVFIAIVRSFNCPISCHAQLGQNKNSQLAATYK